MAAVVCCNMCCGRNKKVPAANFGLQCDFVNANATSYSNADSNMSQDDLELIQRAIAMATGSTCNVNAYGSNVVTQNSESGFAQAGYYSNVPATNSFASDNGYANVYGGYAQSAMPVQPVVQETQYYYGNTPQTNEAPTVYENYEQ